MAVDTAILLTAAITVLWTGWREALGGGQLTAGDLSNATAGTLALAGPIAACLVLLDRGIPIRLNGAFAILAGLGFAGLSMVGFQMTSQSVSGSAFTPSISPTDYAYSIGVLLCSYGAATWQPIRQRDGTRRHAVQNAVDALPPVAAAVCLLVLLLSPADAADTQVLRVGTGLAGVLTVARQMLLTRNERLALSAQRASSAALERELRTRGAVLRSLSRLEIADTPEETAAHVCREALAIDGIDTAILVGFMPGQQAVLLAGTHLEGIPSGLTGAFPPERAKDLYEHASGGPWIETSRPDTAPTRETVCAPNIKCVVNAPLVWRDGTLGVISLGSFAEPSPSVVTERLSTASEFGVVAGALMGPMLGQRAQLEEIQARVAGLIDRHEFQPVFQPIVELVSGRTVGYEALTRFDDGRRPDHWFADAAMAGVGVRLEVATMRAAQEDAEFLPPGRYLSLNVSPALATAFLPLLATLENATRDTVIEITEQVPVESYVGLRAALDQLRGHVRVAVDDAGAGYAGLRHILEIQPKIVKLDVALVRGVNADPARRALISSMVAFAAETSCALVAEGVESEAELTTLRALGVTFGQGYLFGRPSAVEQLTRAVA